MLCKKCSLLRVTILWSRLQITRAQNQSCVRPNGFFYFIIYSPVERIQYLNNSLSLLPTFLRPVDIHRTDHRFQPCEVGIYKRKKVLKTFFYWPIAWFRSYFFLGRKRVFFLFFLNLTFYWSKACFFFR